MRGRFVGLEREIAGGGLGMVHADDRALCGAGDQIVGDESRLRAGHCRDRNADRAIADDIAAGIDIAQIATPADDKTDL